MFLFCPSCGSAYAATPHTLAATAEACRETYWRDRSPHVTTDGCSSRVDLHLSMVPYTQSDRQIFLGFVDAIRIEPKER